MRDYIVGHSLEGKVIKLREGKKKDNIISYDEYGKIIIPVNQDNIHIGYATIERVYANAPNYYRVLVKNCNYDYYNGITPGELIKALKSEFLYKVLYRKDYEDGSRTTILFNQENRCICDLKTKDEKIIDCKITIPGINISNGSIYMFPGLIMESHINKTKGSSAIIHQLHKVINEIPDDYRVYGDYTDFDFDFDMINQSIIKSEFIGIFEDTDEMTKIFKEKGIIND